MKEDKHHHKSGQDAVVGRQTPPRSIEIPEEALIKRDVPRPEVVITKSAAVIGDKRFTALDVLNSTPVEIVVLKGDNLDPEGSGTVVFVDGTVGTDLISAKKARGKFAKKPDGTLIYNSRGFDEVSPTTEYDLVDVVKLTELLRAGTTSSRKKE